MRIDRSKDKIEKMLQVDNIFVWYGFVTYKPITYLPKTSETIESGNIFVWYKVSYLQTDK